MTLLFRKLRWLPVVPGRWWPEVVVLLLLAVAFAPALLQHYGYYDDYLYAWWISDPAVSWSHSHFLEDGRFLLHLLQQAAFSRTVRVEDLLWLRWFSFGGAAAAALMLLREAARAGWPASSTVVVAGLSLTTPAVAVGVAWATCWVFSWGAFLALLGGSLAADLLLPENLPGASRRSGRPVVAWLRPAVLLFAALSIYQPLGGWFFLPLLLRGALAKERITWPLVARWLILLALVYLGYLFSYFAFKWLVLPLGRERGAWLTDPWERLGMLCRLYAPTALQGWGALLPQPWPWILGITTGLGAITAVLPGKRDRVPFLLLGLVALMVSFFPGFLLKNLWEPFRTYHSAYAVVWFAWVAGTLAWPRFVASGVRWGMLFASVAASLVLLQVGMVGPARQERQAVRQAISSWIERPARIALRAPLPPYLAASRWRPSREFGCWTTRDSWVAPLLLALEVNAMGLGEIHHWDVLLVNYPNPATAPPGCAVVDLHAHLFHVPSLTVAPADSSVYFVPGLGTLDDLGEEKFVSPWLGTIERQGDRWLLPYLGPVELVAPEADGAWLRAPVGGLLWTGPLHWPSVYWKETDTWQNLREERP